MRAQAREASDSVRKRRGYSPAVLGMRALAPHGVHLAVAGHAVHAPRGRVGVEHGAGQIDQQQPDGQRLGRLRKQPPHGILAPLPPAQPHARRRGRRPPADALVRGAVAAVQRPAPVEPHELLAVVVLVVVLVV